MINRRDVLRLGAALPLLGLSPAHAAAPRRCVILLELNGGNDGLNTVVPFRDPAYRRARPRLALGGDAVVAIHPQLGLNRALEPLLPVWESKELALALGVGYPEPNRSHFRSIEIWNGGTSSHELADAGWVAGLKAIRGRGAVDGLVLGGPAGPLAGGGLRTVILKAPARFLRQAQQLDGEVVETQNPALAHVLAVRSGVRSAADRIEARSNSAPALPASLPGGRLGRQLGTAARLLAAGLDVPVIKIAQSGYDTHAGQPGRHTRLLTELAEALAGFRTACQQLRVWDRVLVMTYAEFGRRVKENGSVGTDHGTAAPHLLMGGAVTGGLHGRQPSLTDLDGGDLKHHLDYRRLYATAARFLGAAPPAGYGRPLPCVRV